MGGRIVGSYVMAGLLACMTPIATVVGQSVAVGMESVGKGKAALVTLDVRNEPVEQVLRMIARQAGLQMYVPMDRIPSGTRVSLRVQGVSASDAFARVLAGTGLQALVAGGQVAFSAVSQDASAAVVQGSISGKVVDAKTKQGLRGATVSLSGTNKGTTTNDDGRFHFSGIAPGSFTVQVRMLGYLKASKTVIVAEAQTVTMEFVLEPSINALDQVVVTGTVVATAQREIPNAMTVITAREIEQRGITHIDQLFRGDVPGLFAVNMGSGGGALGEVTMFSRGASAIPAAVLGGVASTSPIKTYVDGVEMADPQYLSQIDPASIERIEIVAGPQASVIYGSNAINGVMQIFTKRGLEGRLRPDVTATFTSGVVQNNFSPALSPQHDEKLQITGTDQRWSYNAGGSWIHIAPWTPSRQSDRISGFGGIRMHHASIVADATFRIVTTRNIANGSEYQKRSSFVDDGFYRPATTSLGRAPRRRSTMTGQTLGVTLGYAPTSWWSHEIVVGDDGSNAESLQLEPGYRPGLVNDTSLSYSQTRMAKTSFRYSTTAKLSVSSKTNATVTMGVDRWNSLLTTASASPTSLTGTLGGAQAPTRYPSHNAGGFMQAQLGVADALFFTAGLRAEWNPYYGDAATPNIVPRYGIAYTRDFGLLTAKWRASYGRSTRPPLSDQKGSRAADSYLVPTYGPYESILANPDLGPEHQQGGEGGLELYFGNRASLLVTRYNQTVDGLITYAVVDSVRSLLPYQFPQPYWPDGYQYATQLQFVNIGSIRNQGWELQGSVVTGPVTTKGTYSWTKSRFTGITPKYRSQFKGVQYAVGAPVDYLPEHTWAIDMTYAQSATSVGLHINGTGMLYRRMDAVSFNADDVGNRMNSLIRLSQERVRMGLPDGYVAKGTPYAIGAVNVSHRFSSSIEGLLQIDNVTNAYQLDSGAQYATLGRQTKAGIRVRW